VEGVVRKVTWDAPPVPLGATATESVLVTHELTVAHYHPGLPAAYGTPMMVYLMEIAAAKAVAPYLPAGWVSVGVSVDVKHLAATPVGQTVTATATVITVGEKTITFAVSAEDDLERIGVGTHVRALIDLERFNRRLTEKARRP
jgi:fluoroacetyl-CoA thioesterase